VIGVNSYANIAGGQLYNAINDARLIKDTLRGIGFRNEDIIFDTNVDRSKFLDRLTTFAGRIEKGDTAMFFFAGHGVSFHGANYLLPSDIPSPRGSGPAEESRMAEHAIAETSVIERMTRAGARVAIVVLDACRNNPLQVGNRRSLGDSRGLSPSQPPQGVFSIYSAGLGQIALDNITGDGNPNSVFTRVFAEKLKTPGLGLRGVITQTRGVVFKMAESVAHEQSPAYYDQIIGDDIYLAGLPLGAGTIAPPESTKPALGLFHRPLDAAQERALKPRDMFKECDECPEMVVLPAGSYLMGIAVDRNGWSEDDAHIPQHRVTIPKSFAVGRFEITVDQFAAFVTETGYNPGGKCFVFDAVMYDAHKQEKPETSMLPWFEKTGHSWRSPGYPHRGSHPVACINWYDAKAYAAWLERKSGKQYRLLSEAEWEYAARAGAQTRVSFGDSYAEIWEKICSHGNTFDEAANYGRAKAIFGQMKDSEGNPAKFRRDGFEYTSPIGSFSANGFGLYDMYGNTWEITEHCGNKNYDGAPTDGSAWLTGDCTKRMRRGGSFRMPPHITKVRHDGSAEDRVDDVGFRVARMLP
jgi:formylglycine-generating enzyme required for sulfatase activity